MFGGINGSGKYMDGSENGGFPQQTHRVFLQKMIILGCEMGGTTILGNPHISFMDPMWSKTIHDSIEASAAWWKLNTSFLDPRTSCGTVPASV